MFTDLLSAIMLNWPAFHWRPSAPAWQKDGAPAATGVLIVIVIIVILSM